MPKFTESSQYVSRLEPKQVRIILILSVFPATAINITFQTR